MPENRPNEDRYTSKYQDYGDSKGRGLPVEGQPEFLEKPRKFTPANSHGPNGPYKNVIEKLTAPPETFLEHAERIGLNINMHEIKRGDGVVLRRHYSINFSDAELQEAENGNPT